MVIIIFIPYTSLCSQPAVFNQPTPAIPQGRRAPPTKALPVPEPEQESYENPDDLVSLVSWNPCFWERFLNKPEDH